MRYQFPYHRDNSFIVACVLTSMIRHFGVALVRGMPPSLILPIAVIGPEIFIAVASETIWFLLASVGAGDGAEARQTIIAALLSRATRK